MGEAIHFLFCFLTSLNVIPIITHVRRLIESMDALRASAVIEIDYCLFDADQLPLRIDGCRKKRHGGLKQ